MDIFAHKLSIIILTFTITLIIQFWFDLFLVGIEVSFESRLPLSFHFFSDLSFLIDEHNNNKDKDSQHSGIYGNQS